MADIMDLIRNKKKAIQQSSGRRQKTVKPVSGKNKFRILPNPGDEEGQFWQDFGQHFIKDTNDKLQAVYMCVEKTHERACPICEGIAQGINEAGDDEIIEALKESRSSSRVLVNALHLDGEDAKTPVILELSPTTFEKVLELMEEYGNVTSLSEGIDILITRSGTGLNTEYSVLPAAKSKPVDAAVLKNLHNLGEYVEQEYDEGRNKAIAAVSNVSGLMLAAPPADKPLAKSLSAPVEDSLDDDMYAESSAEEPKKEEAIAKADSDEISDDELDDMLASL
ncbi:MAG: hypothetical protein HRT93_10840 [Piscirickettsiaceae bacterium]|nr:hypothetical protein [Piscirickettsiaceae bacterium]